MKKQTVGKGKASGKPMMMDQMPMKGKGQMKGMTGKKPGKC